MRADTASMAAGRHCDDPGGRWSVARAAEWYARQPWLVGCNFLPSTAANQLEMWQAETFDAATIDRELGWAAAIGLNTVRVFLHDLAWQADRDGFLARLDRVLAIASAHGIRPLLVFFDDCWHEPCAGAQPAPRPGVHNSCWVRSPGEAVLRDRRQWERLEAYVRDVVDRHADDPRVLAWDVYNEPTNGFLPLLGQPLPRLAWGVARAAVRRLVASRPSRDLLRLAFAWVRAARPSQPLTAGLWFPDPPLNALLVHLSDVISFHHYRSPASLERMIARLRRHGRPLLCTEYLARSAGCTFATHLPIFRRERVGCWHWGLVDGRSQTKFSWRGRRDGSEPDPWFHDLLRADGSPYDPAEVAVITDLTRRRGGAETLCR